MTSKHCKVGWAASNCAMTYQMDIYHGTFSVNCSVFSNWHRKILSIIEEYVPFLTYICFWCITEGILLQKMIAEMVTDLWVIISSLTKIWRPFLLLFYHLNFGYHFSLPVYTKVGIKQPCFYWWTSVIQISCILTVY